MCGAEWYPDGSALLVVHGYQARSEMFRYDLADRRARRAAADPRAAR